MVPTVRVVIQGAGLSLFLASIGPSLYIAASVTSATADLTSGPAFGHGKLGHRVALKWATSEPLS